MLPIPKIIWYESTAKSRPVRINEPSETMNGLEQVRSYVQAYAWGGPTSALQFHHLRELSHRLRPGDTVVDLACGPGPLLLELAEIYPECHFVGVDLSTLMLDHLKVAAAERRLDNISILQEDIREIPSLVGTRVDLVISTSALHHVPDHESLGQVFERIGTLTDRTGGFYLFDFALLKSRQARELFVAEVARLAPPITVRDYDVSLQAAFPLEIVLDLAAKVLPRPYTAQVSAFVDFFYFLQSPPRASPSTRLKARLDEIWSSLPLSMKWEYLMLKSMRRSRSYN